MIYFVCHHAAFIRTYKEEYCTLCNSFFATGFKGIARIPFEVYPWYDNFCVCHSFFFSEEFIHRTILQLLSYTCISLWTYGYNQKVPSNAVHAKRIYGESLKCLEVDFKGFEDERERRQGKGFFAGICGFPTSCPWQDGKEK